MTNSNTPSGLYFNVATVPNNVAERDTYVCWIDVMGTSSIMSRSLRTGANFVMKLHRAVMETAVTPLAPSSASPPWMGSMPGHLPKREWSTSARPYSFAWRMSSWSETSIVSCSCHELLSQKASLPVVTTTESGLAIRSLQTTTANE